MNKYEYLSQLRAGLVTLPKDERDAAMSYYEEFFSDAGEDNEQAVIASLGSPQELSQSIIKDSKKDAPSDENDQDQKNGFEAPETGRQASERTATRWSSGQIALMVVLLVLSSPLWLGLVFGILGTAFGIVCAVFGITFGFAAGAAIAIVSGIIALFSTPAQGLLAIGIGLVLGGLVPLALYPLCKLVIKLISCIIKGIGSLINKLSGKTGVSTQ